MNLTEDEVKTLKELLVLSKSITESLNTGAINNLAQTVSTLDVVVEYFNKPEIKNLIDKTSNNYNNNDLVQLTEKIVEMNKNGTLDSLIELSNFIASIINSITPGIILKMTHLIPEPRTINILEKTIEATKEVQEQIDRDSPKIGLGTLVRSLKDPDIQYMLSFILLLSKRMAKIINKT